MALVSADLLSSTSGAIVMVPLHGGSAPLVDFGQFVLWALPVGKFLFNVSAAAVVGALVLASTALSRDRPEYARALNFAAIAAAVWTVVSGATMVFAYLDAADGVASSDLFGLEFGLFITSVGLGQTWLVTTIIAAIVTMLCFAVRRAAAVGATAILAVGALVPLTLNGHPNYGEGHEAGMAAFGLHILAAAVWLGGLITLVALRPVLGSERLTTIVRRYSTIALFSFIVLAASGYLRAQATIGSLANLASTFGVLVLIKVAALVLLGILGFTQRRWIISRMERDRAGGRRPLWILVSAELLLIGLASGIAPVLAQVDAPVPDVPVTYDSLAERMVDQPLPAAPSLWGFVTELGFDPIWLLISITGAVLYLAGVRRINKLNGKWPVRRTVYWLAGMAVLLYITNGGVNVYRNFLLSAQLLAQMSLLVVVPVLLARGRPLSLASRTVEARHDGSLGIREWISAVRWSPVTAILLNPYVATAVLIASLLVFYYSPLLGWASSDPVGHQIMVVYFLVIGALFVASLRRPAPLPGMRSPDPLYAALGVMVFYAGLGLALLSSPNLLLPEWYGRMESPWGISPVDDQQLAGAYVMIIGVVQGTVLSLALLRRHPMEPALHETTNISVISQEPPR